ncbi:MAG: S26 family signal peptidase [Planctomycetaceae bacterium]
MELSILFVTAVLVLRGFFLEGYLISTGSMAPGLLGLHKRIACPSCRQSFAFGVTFDESVAADPEDSELSHRYATCPNCGQANIEIGEVPVNHGDQLLVHKGVFDLRRPKRWEAVVFRNPASPGEAYLKRVVGLPGELLQVIDGDVFIEGEIAVKDYATQREMRIPVHDIAHLSAADDWQPSWQTTGRWQQQGHRWLCRGGTADDGDSSRVSPDWLHFRHWRRSGGNHFCETPLQGADAEADWQQCLERLNQRSVLWLTRLKLDRERQVLQLKGVMPPQMQQDLLAESTSEAFRSAVYRLAALSHLSPVTDRYGYNSLVASPEFPVRDLMLEAALRWTTAPDRIVVQLPLDSDVYQLELNPAAGTAILKQDGSERPLRAANFAVNDSTAQVGLTIEASNFDHQILVAIDGVPLFEPLPLAFSAADSLVARTTDGEPRFAANADDAPRTAEFVTRQNRLALGVSGGNVSVEVLRVYRDVHYTPGRRTNGVNSPYRIGADAYFVQGDNSPVSSDSRNWPDPAVPHTLLIGKPFVVHLPSKPGKVTIGGFQLPIRIPDFGRIRYIH